MAKKYSPLKDKEELPLSQAADILLSQARMLLPGIQAVFGFQLIAVFSSLFDEKLSSLEQKLHWLSMALVAVTIVTIMTPAAYHRQTGTRTITQEYIDISTHLMLLSVLIFALSICVEFYLVSRLIFKSVLGSLLLTLGLLLLFVVMWFVLPRSEFLKTLFSGKEYK